MIKINILEHIYVCTAEAKAQLSKYVSDIEARFHDEQELVRDIELGIIEQLDQILSERTEPQLTKIDIDYLIQKMGTIDMLDASLGIEDQIIAQQRLYRDYNNRIISGVCAGIAAYFNISPWLVRFIFIILLFTPIPIVIPYLLLWYLVPPALTRTEQLNMRGIPVNINSIVNQHSYTRKKIIHLAKLIAIIVGIAVFIGMTITLMVLVF